MTTKNDNKLTRTATKKFLTQVAQMAYSQSTKYSFARNLCGSCRLFIPQFPNWEMAHFQIKQCCKASHTIFLVLRPCL